MPMDYQNKYKTIKINTKALIFIPKVKNFESWSEDFVLYMQKKCLLNKAS